MPYLLLATRIKQGRELASHLIQATNESYTKYTKKRSMILETHIRTVSRMSSNAYRLAIGSNIGARTRYFPIDSVDFLDVTAQESHRPNDANRECVTRHTILRHRRKFHWRHWLHTFLTQMTQMTHYPDISRRGMRSTVGAATWPEDRCNRQMQPAFWSICCRI